MRRSKIYVNPGYLWTGRGPEMHNKPHANRRECSEGLGEPDEMQRHREEIPGMVQSAVSQDVTRQTPGRRSREAGRRARRVEFCLTDEEFGELDAAAAQAGLSRGAYAAEAALAAARGVGGQVGAPLREALVELMSAAGLVRRVGTNLNQAVARLNATGQRGEDLVPAAQFCVRVIRRLDEAAEHLRRSVP